MRKWLTVGALIAVLVVIALVVTRRHDSASSPQAEEEASGPRELVAGVAGIQQPRSTPEDEKVDVTALNAAANYAGSHNSSALIVSRHGHVIFEHYWNGTARDTVVDAGPFARTVAAMLVGVAMDERNIVSAEEPVASFLKSFETGPKANITVRQLLQMDDPRSLVELVEQLANARNSTGARVRYARYLSKNLWKTISAGDAWLVLEAPNGMPSPCCFYARQSDWLRLAELLLNDGEYQGSRVLPKGWARMMTTPAHERSTSASQLQLGTPRDGFYLSGSAANRLWMHPALHLAILRLGKHPAKAWDESRIPHLVIAGVLDRPPTTTPDQTDLSKLVPHH